MVIEDIRELLMADPFRPFSVTMSSGERFNVHSPLSAALLSDRLFVTLPDGDHWAFCPFAHIASVKTVAANGRSRTRRKRRQ